jgi:hypothetical protein
MQRSNSTVITQIINMFPSAVNDKTDEKFCIIKNTFENLSAYGIRFAISLNVSVGLLFYNPKPSLGVFAVLSSAY